MLPISSSLWKRRFDAISGLRLSVLLVVAVLFLAPVLLSPILFGQGEIRTGVKIIVLAGAITLPALASVSLIQSSWEAIRVIQELSKRIQ